MRQGPYKRQLKRTGAIMPKINHEKIALYLEKLVAGWDEELAREMIENLTPDERVHLSRLLDICRKGKPAPA
tara:strand:- start:356 stop:571 length:216 start_codon:yes stop_codon:yes gene_type:complete